MNKKHQWLLVDYFDEIRKGETAQENIKIKLYQSEKGLKELFGKLAGQNKLMMPSTLKEYLQGKIDTTENDLYVLFRKFDHKLQGKVFFQQFKQQMTPISEISNKSSTQVASQIQQMFLGLLQCYLYHEDILNVARKSLKQIVPYEAFDHIAIEFKGFICKSELQAFYKSNDKKLKQKNLELLMHGLRRRSYRNVTLEAFCENLNPLEMGYYEKYQRAINQYQEKKYKFQEKKQANEVKKRKKQQDKIVRKQIQDCRVKEAEENRNQYIKELIKLKQKAQKQKGERELLQKTLQMQQKIRHQLQKQIKLFKEEANYNENNRKLLNRLSDIKSEQLAESRELQDKIYQQEKYLQGLKEKVVFEKNHLYNQSLHNKNFISCLKAEKQNSELRQLSHKQQSLYTRMLSPVTQKQSLHNDSKLIGKIYSSTKYNDTPIYDLYKSTLGSTAGDFNRSMYSSQPQLKTSYLYRY